MLRAFDVPIYVVAAILWLVAFVGAGTGAGAGAATTAPTVPFWKDESAPTRSLLYDGEVIGATSLAAAAGAAVAAESAVGIDFSLPQSATETITTNTITTTHSNSSHHNNADRGSDPFIAASANLLLEPELHTSNGHMANLTRHHAGDVFRTSGVINCNADTCVGLSSGTAGLMHSDGVKGSAEVTRVRAVGSFAVGNTGVGRSESAASRRMQTQAGMGETCECRCLPYLSTYREDLGICVDDIHECMLSPFVSGSSSEKIPFVFLPLRGQIIYPSREISFPDIRTPVCAVSGAQYLTTNGWSDLRNPIDSDYPFRMFRDEGRTFLQWLGEADLRQKMQGRLIVVHLVCREMMLALNATATEHLMAPKNVFSPCVAFRVNGSPVKYYHNVSEVLFQSEATSTLASTSDGMTTKEYVVIGVCSLLLGLIYVASVFLYLHMKKRKGRDRTHMRNSLDDLENEINYPKNDQVTFGAPFNRTGSLYSATSLGTSNEPRSRGSIGNLKEDMGIVKNNPLLQHFPQLSDHHSGFASDISNSNSECEMDVPSGGSCGYHDKLKQLQTSALVHPQMSHTNGNGSGSPKGVQSHGSSSCNDDEPTEPSLSPTQENECLPAENCSIVEDMMTEEKLENLRAMVNGIVRKKLYFNPAYFEPHLLAQPPPAAIEFLQKIREVIAIAKYKMSTKRYQPSLNMIPEEGPLRSNTPSQIQSCGECRDCANHRCSGHLKNCGDKRNSIEKWLQSVSETEEQSGNDDTDLANSSGNASDPTVQKPDNIERQQSALQSAHPSKGNAAKQISTPAKRNSARKEITPPKTRPPPPPTPARNQNKEDSASVGSEASIIEVNGAESSPADTTNATYPIYSTNINTGSSVTIPINRNYERFSALSAAANIYGFAEMGSEIYNNPKFMLHDSPSASMRSRGSSHHSKCSRKRLDVLDQYAAASTPTSLTSAERQHYEMLRNMKQMPDLNYDSIGRDYNSNFQLDIPTPDYDSTIEKKIKDIYNNTQSSAPSVPTPDYSTLSRKSLKQGQPPDSPIYRRKSPQYLIVDYETDSLERLETTKRKSSQSSSSPSSDVSSQLSPSLSTALPLEEELEISHTVYDKMDGFRKEGNTKKKLVGKTDSKSSKHKDIATRIKYDTPFLGSMTIEVEHEPPSDMEPSTDSEQFDPDTLDRMPKKQSFCDMNTWSDQLRQSQNKANCAASATANAKAVHTNAAYSSYGFQSNRSFASQSSGGVTYESRVETTKEEDLKVSFNNLKDLYQTAIMRPNSQQSCKCGGQASKYLAQKLDSLSEQGRLLTLEAKHSRRQRITEPPASTTPPAVVEITKVAPNKTTIKISTPKISRAAMPTIRTMSAATVEPEVQIGAGSNASPSCSSNPRKGSFRSDLDNFKRTPSITSIHLTPSSPVGSNVSSTPLTQKKPARYLPAPPPPPRVSQQPEAPPSPSLPTSSATTLNSQKSSPSSHYSHFHPHPHFEKDVQYVQNLTTATEEDTMSNHSESTEITGVSDTVANSDVDGSCNNTLSASAPKADNSKVNDLDKHYPAKHLETTKPAKKLGDDKDYGAMFNTKINGLRNDYSLTKYMNRRKLQERDEKQSSCMEADTQLETNNNISVKNNALDLDPNRAEVLSIGSRSNQSSSRLSDRTKEMYRNAGVPVGIAYPQRSTAGNNSSASAATTSTTVQTVYRCEIEPVQLTHGMQIAMGLKDRAKKAKDLKNAWKKFVSMAAAKFSPTQSPAPPFEKKVPSILEVLERDEGISSLIDEQPRVSTPKSSYSAPASQNYYEQRFGARPQEMDSGYMSADSGEAYKRNFYDRYNFKMMSGRDHIIRVDTIEDNSDGGSTITNRHNGEATCSRRASILDSNRFEDLEHMGDPPPNEAQIVSDDNSDAESDQTITQQDGRSGSRRSGTLNTYSSEDEQGLSTSYGSSETDGETNAEDMWESGAESIETHSVLYKNVRKNLNLSLG